MSDTSLSELPVSEAALIIAPMVFAVVMAGMGPLMRLLGKLRILDHPNERSSHVKPTPVGGGLLIVAAVLPAWLWLSPEPRLDLILPAAALAGLSLVDDFRRIPAGVRLAGHLGAVSVVLYAQPDLVDWLPDAIPAPLAFVGVGLAWTWFINLYNFMDGIDGITGVETIAIAVGTVAVCTAGAAPGWLADLAFTAAAAAAGFLVWNWHPARIFMGDVGSVTLGFLLGWLLLSLAAAGAWAPALILPGYYLADATLTMFRRLARGEAIWRGHREHFYQAAVMHGLTHAQVSVRISITNAALVVLAAIAATNAWGSPFWPLAGAALVITVLLALFRREPPTGP